MGYFGDGHRFGCTLTYAVQEPETVGSGPSCGLTQALRAGHHLLVSHTVVFGMPSTIIQPVDAFTCLRHARFAEADLALALFRTDTPHKLGMVDFDADERVRSIVDKPAETELEWMWGAILRRPRFTRFMNACLERSPPTDFAGILNAAIAEDLDPRASRTTATSTPERGMRSRSRTRSTGPERRAAVCQLQQCALG